MSSPDRTTYIDRRLLLKTGVVVAVSGGSLLLWERLNSQNNRSQSDQENLQREKTSFGDRIQILKEKVAASDLAEISADPNNITKESLTKFLTNAQNAEVNFQKLEEYGLFSELNSKLSTKFTNPDLDINNFSVIPGMRQSLLESIVYLERSGWNHDKKELELGLSFAIQRFNLPLFIRAQDIADVFGNINSPQEQSYPYFYEVPEPHMRNANERLEENLSTLPVPPRVRFFLRQSAFKTEGTFQYGPYVSDILFATKAVVSPKEQDQEFLYLTHEVGHSLDIFTNPNVLRFVSTDQLDKLLKLRINAAMSHPLPDIDQLFSLMDTHRSPFIEEIDYLVENSQLNPDYFGKLTNRYPTGKWIPQYSGGGNRVSNLVNREIDIKSYEEFLVDHADSPRIGSWEEFGKSDPRILESFSNKGGVIKFSVDQFRQRIDRLPSPFGQSKQPFEHWATPFIIEAPTLFLLTDVATNAESRQYLTRSEYRDSIEALPELFVSSEGERFAENFSLAIYLKDKKGVDSEKLMDQNYFEYFKLISEIFGKKKF